MMSMTPGYRFLAKITVGGFYIAALNKIKSFRNSRKLERVTPVETEMHKIENLKT